MKLIILIGALTFTLIAGDSICNTPLTYKCFMTPSSEQNSRENLIWIGPACWKATENISADLTSQNSRHTVLSKGTTSEKIGATTIVYSEKNDQFITREVETR